MAPRRSRPPRKIQVAGDRLTLAFSRVVDPALTYTVRASDDLVTWTKIWSSTGAANTSGPVTVTDTVSLSSQPRRFLQLAVSR